MAIYEIADKLKLNILNIFNFISLKYEGSKISSVHLKKI